MLWFVGFLGDLREGLGINDGKGLGLPMGLACRMCRRQAAHRLVKLGAIRYGAWAVHKAVQYH